MKNKFSILVCSALVLLGSCRKEENKIFFMGGTPPVLSASSTNAMVLTGANAANHAVKFSWTNPNYEFNTGVSSHDVNYILEVDTTGANFSSSLKQEVSIPRDLSINYTVRDLNQILTRMNLAENTPHNIDFRIKSTLAGNSVPLYSNVIKITITPYLDVAVPLPPTDELYMTGSATGSGWTNSPPAGQKTTPGGFTSTGRPTTFTITTNLNPGGEYKFLSTLGFWQPQYGGSSATGGDIGYNMGLPGQSDPPAIPTPSVAGSYKITLNFKTGKYTVEKQ